jgi:hypothetical protein
MSNYTRIQELHEAAIEAALYSAESFLKAARARMEREMATYNAKIAQAMGERDVINDAGGEKALGNNAAARERALIVALRDNKTIQQSLNTAAQLRFVMDEADALGDAYILIARLNKTAMAALGSMGEQVDVGSAPVLPAINTETFMNDEGEAFELF